LKVTTGNNVYSGKLISDKETGGIIAITYQNTIIVKDNLANTKSANSEILMQYNTGDVLKFTATSGENKSVKVEVISQSKNIEIPFYKCTDPDKRNYATVKIGTQVWMAENLAYLPTVGPPKTSTSAPLYYVYGYPGSDVDTAKQQSSYTTYGVLYNWPAAKATCPPGWHLPSDAEWTTLENYLIANGFNYDGTTTGNYIAKSLAATTNWSTYWNIGIIGKDLSLNNKSGFSALPGGYRDNYGDYENFFGIKTFGIWWSSTEYNSYAWYRSLDQAGSNVSRGIYRMSMGLSVRCVRDY